MKEGRMKDQAFITFPTYEWAQLALEEAHGYQLQEKPIILVSIRWNRRNETMELR
jgi:RNA recognition motif-containing protein